MKIEKLSRHQRRKWKAVQRLDKKRKGEKWKAEAMAREVGRIERHINRTRDHKLFI